MRVYQCKLHRMRPGMCSMHARVFTASHHELVLGLCLSPENQNLGRPLGSFRTGLRRLLDRLRVVAGFFITRALSLPRPGSRTAKELTKKVHLIHALKLLDMLVRTMLQRRFCDTVSCRSMHLPARRWSASDDEVPDAVETARVMLPDTAPE